MINRRTLLQASGLAITLGSARFAQAAAIVGARVWPAKEYTRLTIESDVELRVSQQYIASPPRLAVDIEGLQVNTVLKELMEKVRSDDPNIAGIRIGQYSPTVARLVIDLKHFVRPQVFKLAPVSPYQHRLVMDLHPEQEPDLAPVSKSKAKPEPEATAAAKAAKPEAVKSDMDPLEAMLAQRAGAAGTDSAPATAELPSKGSDSSDPLADLIAQQTQKSQAGATATPSATAASATTSVAKNDRVASAASTSSTKTKPAPVAAPAIVTSKTRMDRAIIIALDPGHGGEDSGAVGPGGTQEKNVVLRLGKMLRQRINESTINGNPMRAYMTRDADFFVPLDERVRKARRAQADLFMSIHADAFQSPTPQGASVFALSQKGATSSTAKWFAAKENNSDLIGGVNIQAKDTTVQRAMLDMSTAAQIKDSLKLGGTLIGEMSRVGKLHHGSVEQAGFAVLKAPDIPSVLVETAFISNPQEEMKLGDDVFLGQMADALLRGIGNYFAKNPPMARSNIQS